MIPAHVFSECITIARCSPCQSKRGVVIFSESGGYQTSSGTSGRIITRGFNRPPAPFVCDGSDRCKQTCGRSAVHAEQVALLAAGWQAHGESLLHIKVVDGQPVGSLNPSCLECSKLILEAGIVRVYLLHDSGSVSLRGSTFSWEPIDEHLVVAGYMAEEFHRRTAEDWHSIQLVRAGGAR